MSKEKESQKSNIEAFKQQVLELQQGNEVYITLSEMYDKIQEKSNTNKKTEDEIQ